MVSHGREGTQACTVALRPSLWGILDVNANAFCTAVEAGDLDAVRGLVQGHHDLVHAEWTGAYWTTAVQFAVANRHVEMTRLLMELGSDARIGTWPHRNATDAYTLARDRGYDELVAIIEQEEERRRQEMSSPGATVSKTTEEIHNAILEGRSEDALRMMERDPSLIGACSLRGATPLHVAAWAQATNVIGWLLEHGASVDARDAEGHTPLDYAAFVAGWSSHGRHFCFLESSKKSPEDFLETVRLLRSAGGELTPRTAVAIGDIQAIVQRHREGRLPNEIHTLRGGLLSIAVRVNRIDIVSLLLDLGLDPDETVRNEEGPRESWGMPLWFTALCGRPKIAELLLARGADVNGVVYASGDAICTAQMAKDDEMKSLLRRQGARITVEHVAHDKDRETARAILTGTLPAQSLNVDNPTPTDLAEQMLWAAGGVDPEIVRMCLPHMTREPDDPWWNYVLMHATLPESFQLLLDYGIDPHVSGGGGFTLLHHLASDWPPAESRVPRATMLLKAGASLNHRDPMLESTPLGWAARWGRLDLARLYLEHGADPHEPDTEPWARPLAWAMKRGHAEVVELLGDVERS